MVQSILHLVKLELVILSVNNYNQQSDYRSFISQFYYVTSD